VTNPRTVQPSPARRRDHTHDYDYVPEVLRQPFPPTLTPNDSSTTLDNLEIEIKQIDTNREHPLTKVIIESQNHCDQLYQNYDYSQTVPV